MLVDIVPQSKSFYAATENGDCLVSPGRVDIASRCPNINQPPSFRCFYYYYYDVSK